MEDSNITKLESDLAEMTERWKRAVADYHNLEKRQLDATTDLIERSIAGVVSEFLPVIDQLEKAVEHGDEGMSSILKNAKKTLEDLGVSTVTKIGDIFDPLKHEAVELAEGVEDEKILEILEQGYEFGKE